MATTIQLKSFTAKTTPVPADLIYAGNSASSFDEVKCTIAEIISAYPGLYSIGNLVTAANEIIYTNGIDTYTTAPITAFALSVLALITPTTTPTAGLFAGWDANKNLSANNFLAGYATTVTAAGTTTLLVGSAHQQYFTGSTTQDVVLPVTSTLVLGQQFAIVNNSSGVVTIRSSGGNTILAMAAGSQATVTCILTSGATAASWSVSSYTTSSVTFPLSVLNGGTGVTTVTIAPTPSAFAGWDANSNFSAVNLISGYATTATAAGTTTLTVGSAHQQFFSGVTTQNLDMPVTSTLVLGQSWFVVNNSSGVVTIRSSGGNTILAMAADTQALITCILTSGTTASSWDVSLYTVNNITFPLSIAQGGTGVTSATTTPTASSFAAWDANSNLRANNHLEGYTTTATAAGTTVLTVASTYQQFFTGATTQTVTLPVTSTLLLGHQFLVVNNSSGAITVQSSGGNTITTMAANSDATFTCILTSGTTASSWNSDYSLNTPGISVVTKQTFTANGTYTPTLNMKYCIIECWGAGGGGAGTANSGGTEYRTGGGGGAGGYSRTVATAATVGASQVVTIGTLGGGGSAGANNGSAGTATSVGAICIANGGAGGISATWEGGAGGTAGTGDIAGTGMPGVSGGTMTGALIPTGGGGSSSIGGGGVANRNQSTGAAGTGKGSGGAGGVSYVAGGAAAGGAGTAGFVMITEYV